MKGPYILGGMDEDAVRVFSFGLYALVLVLLLICVLMLIITAQGWQQWLLTLLVFITFILFLIPIAGVYFLGIVLVIFSLLFAGYVVKSAYASSVWIVEKLLFAVLLIIFIALVVICLHSSGCDLDLYSH